MNIKPLGSRLELAAELCEGSVSAADVGCDHGLLAIELIKNRGLKKVIASDINHGPLEKARANIAAADVSGIELRLCDGLSGIASDEVDTVIILGMGGELIGRILEASPWAMDGRKLILQPMTRPQMLRKFLWENGCAVEKEYLVKDGGFVYPVILARGGKTPEHPGHFLFSDTLRGDPLFKGYLLRLRGGYAKILEGRPGDAEAARMLEIIEEELSVL